MNVKVGAILLALPLSACPLGKTSVSAGTQAASPAPVSACGVVLERETVRISVGDLPAPGGGGGISFAETEYLLYNPTEEDAALDFLLPCGMRAEYLTAPDFGALGFEIETDGVPAELKTRFSYVGYFDRSPDLESCIERMTAPRSDFYGGDLTVTEYTFSFPAQEQGVLKLHINCNQRNTRLLSDARMSADVVNGDLRILIDVKNSPVSLYAIGEKPSVCAGSLYSDRTCKEIAGEVSREETEYPFCELALRDYDEASGISEEDWAAGFSEMLSENTGVGGTVYAPARIRADQFMQWYEYGVTVAAHGRVVHTVKAPILPTVKEDGYEFTYRVAPARRFPSCDSFRVEISTPYALSDGSLDLSEGEGGYRAERTSLPFDDFNFTLSVSDSEDPPSAGLSPSVKLAVIIISVVAGVGIALLVWRLVVLRKKK